MRAFDRNFARAVRIFDPNFMRGGRKPARPRDKILNGERVLRGDRILSGDGILSDRALNVGKIPSGGILNDGKIWIDNKILKGGGILSGSGILNLTPRGDTRRGFSRRILRGFCAEASPLHLRRKFQSASGLQTDYKFKRATALQTDRKFKIAVGLRVACKFKNPMQEFHRGSATTELLRQKSSSDTVLRNCLKFRSSPYALARLKFVGSMSEMGANSRSALLKFQISVAAPSQLKFRDVPNAITRLKFQSAMAVALTRLKSGSSPRAAQRRKIRAQGQGR